MKPDLMRNWQVIQNGNQIDLHVQDKPEGRSLTIAKDIRDRDVASLMAAAPCLLETLQQIANMLATSKPIDYNADCFRVLKMTHDAISTAEAAPTNPNAGTIAAHPKGRWT